MKKLLILIAFGAVFLHFYPQPELESWYEQQKKYVLNEISKATDTKIRLSVEKISEVLQSDLEKFSEEELDYLKEITTDTDSVKQFFTTYCKQGVASDMLTKANVTRICQVMNEYQSLM